MIRSLTAAEVQQVLFSWPLWARPKQLAPVGVWRTWLLSAGRGFGKTRCGAEWVREMAEKYPGCRIALVGRTTSDPRDVLVEGESGILAISPPWFRPKYQPTRRRLVWPNGSQAATYSADEPDVLRGPQHHFAWADELAAWRYAQDAWDMLMFGLRLGDDPRVCVTTTPRPTKIIRDLVADPTTHVTRGSTYENKANLAAPFLAQILKKYEGTRLGRQELEAEILDDAPGALWKRNDIDAQRVRVVPPMRRIVVAIDPAVSNDEDSDETGIVVAGLGEDGHGYVLDDLSGRYSPNEWATKAVAAYEKHGASRIVAEVNNGGALVEANLRTVGKNAAYKAVRAAVGKRARAEPIAALYEQRRVHHVGTLAALEDQMCGWSASTGEKSPDRLDAAVYALSELMLSTTNFEPYESVKVGSRKVA